MDREEYKKILLAKEHQLLAREQRAESNVRTTEDDQEVRDWSDGAVVDEDKSIASTEAGDDATLLGEVRAALQRIADGTFGRCRVDGKPIEEKRLRDVPWAAYCIRHQKEIEQGLPHDPTL